MTVKSRNRHGAMPDAGALSKRGVGMPSDQPGGVVDATKVICWSRVVARCSPALRWRPHRPWVPRYTRRSLRSERRRRQPVLWSRSGFVLRRQVGRHRQHARVKAAQAAVSYANNYLGGLGGHKTTLNVCNPPDTVGRDRLCHRHGAGRGLPIVITPVSGQSERSTRASRTPESTTAVRIARPGRDLRSARQCLRSYQRYIGTRSPVRPGSLRMLGSRRRGSW